MVAEFWALRDGLILASQLDIQHLKIELDAKVVVYLINSSNSVNAAYSSLLVDCRWLLNRVPRATVKHVFRESVRGLAFKSFGSSHSQVFKTLGF